jgi:hypothetical protein
VERSARLDILVNNAAMERRRGNAERFRQIDSLDVRIALQCLQETHTLPSKALLH